MNDDVDVYPRDGSDITLILAYNCEIFTLYPISQRGPASAFRAAFQEAQARDQAAARALLASA